MNEIFGIPANTLMIVLLAITGLILLIVALVAWRYPLSFRLGLRNLSRRRSQTALVIGGLALSTMIITSALGIGDTIDYSTKVQVYEDSAASTSRSVPPVSKLRLAHRSAAGLPRRQALQTGFLPQWRTTSHLWSMMRSWTPVCP